MAATQERKTNEEQGERGITTSGRSLGFGITPDELFRMNPFSLMRRMTQEMSRAFGEERGFDERNRWTPSIEVKTKDNKYLVRAELPGLKPEQVKLEVTDDAVVLQGERKVEHEETKEGVHWSELRYGSFYRAIPLPEGAKADQATAKFDNGVLEISMPLEQPRSQRREIPIQAGSEGKPSPSGSKAA